jgi:hypothetical protein
MSKRLNTVSQSSQGLWRRKNFNPAGPVVLRRNWSKFPWKGNAMKKNSKQAEQPKPFTPGLSKAAVRQRAFELFRDKLPNHPLTLEDWVLAEKDLVQTMQLDQAG